MPVIYDAATQDARLRAVINRIDGAAGIGKLHIFDAGGVLLVSVPLAKPSFDAPLDGVMSLAQTPRVQPYAAARGVPSAAAISDSTGTVIISGLTAGGPGTNVVVNTGEILKDQEVRVDSGVIRHG